MKIRTIFVLVFSGIAITACGGGGGSAQTNGDDAAAVLAQKIRNGAAAVGTFTVVNGANN